MRNIFVNEIEQAKEFYAYYEEKIKADAAIWYSKDVDDTSKLVEDNFQWTCDYFLLRMEMMDELFLIY